VKVSKDTKLKGKTVTLGMEYQLEESSETTYHT
jgi:hypothetical protein